MNKSKYTRLLMENFANYINENDPKKELMQKAKDELNQILPTEETSNLNEAQVLSKIKDWIKSNVRKGITVAALMSMLAASPNGEMYAKQLQGFADKVQGTEQVMQQQDNKKIFEDLRQEFLNNPQNFTVGKNNKISDYKSTTKEYKGKMYIIVGSAKKDLQRAIDVTRAEGGVDGIRAHLEGKGFTYVYMINTDKADENGYYHAISIYEK